MKKILKNIKDWIITDKKAIMVSITVGLIATISTTAYTKIYAESVQANIAGKVIRFHVLANSNTEVDQTLKLKVRDTILKNFTDELENCQNIDESRKLINENMSDIEELANYVIKESGFNYIAKASLEKTDFPTKYYGNVSFPPGEYEALRIEIGEAEGENWWCVMFPPLCFVDITQGNVVENKNPADKIYEPIVYEPILKDITTQIASTKPLKTEIVKNENTEQTVYNIKANIANEKIEEEKIEELKDYKNDLQEQEPELKDYKNDFQDQEPEQKDYKNDFQEEESELKDYKNDFEEEKPQEPLNDYTYKYNNFYYTEKKEYTNQIVLKDIEKPQVSTLEKKGNISEKSKEILKNTLKEEEYNLVTNNDDNEIVPIKIKFKIVEFWQNMKTNKNAYVKK